MAAEPQGRVQLAAALARESLASAACRKREVSLEARKEEAAKAAKAHAAEMSVRMGQVEGRAERAEKGRQLAEARSYPWPRKPLCIGRSLTRANQTSGGVGPSCTMWDRAVPCGTER